jgi:hypothetical protein
MLATPPLLKENDGVKGAHVVVGEDLLELLTLRQRPGRAREKERDRERERERER